MYIHAEFPNLKRNNSKTLATLSFTGKLKN